MDQLKLGSLIDANQKRDAIHIAVAPVVAFERLSPGQDIGFAIEGDTEKVRGSSKEPIGIVDPFLKGAVFPGDRFWMFLYPYTITSLRHDWIHPAFGPERTGPSNELIRRSEQWLRDYAEEIDLEYATVLAVAKEYLRSGDNYVFGHDTPDRCWSDRQDFWKHYEIVTGTKVEDHDAVPFSCAC